MSAQSGQPRPFGRPQGAAWVLALSLAATLGANAGCRQQQSSAPPSRPVLRVGTAFAPFSTRLNEEYRRTLPDIEVSERTQASSANVLNQIQADTLDVGVALADDAYNAYFGEGSDAARPDSKVRALSLLQPLPIYLLARAGSGIISVADLHDKAVAVGPQNSSAWKLGTLVLKAFNVERVDVRPTNSRQGAVKGLKDGTLDAIMLPGYVYPEEFTEALLKEKGAYLVPIDGPPVEHLRRESPFVRVVMIPRDIYPGQNNIVPTVGIDMLIVCRRDLDEQLAYRLTEQLFAVFPRLARVEATMRFLNLEDAPATPIPLHPGAARYFRERELSR